MTWKNVLGMLVLVLLCAGALWWVQSSDDAPDLGPSTVVQPFDKKDVTRLEAHDDEGAELVLRRRPDSTDLWDVKVGLEWARADAIRVDEILGAIMRTDVRRWFRAGEVDEAALESYGLTAPSVTFTLDAPGGERTARYGSRTREGEGAYADRGPGTDVLVVAATALDELQQAFRDGLRDRRLTDLGTYDVKGVEITIDGVTTLQAERDLTQVWRVTQPFRGYADPKAFEARLNHIVNERWANIAEDGAQGLQRYGLAQPPAVVVLTSKRGDTRTLHVGSPVPAGEGARFVMEPGYHSVYVASKRFADAVWGTAHEIRDRSFARVGFGIEAVTVSVEGTAFTLRKAHSEWEVEKPAREPAEESLVEGFLEDLRQWPVIEFLDSEDPAAYGVSPEGDQLQVEVEGGGVTTLLLGKETADGNRYAQRKDDGGLVIVLGAPVRRMLEGWLPFKRRSALELPIEDVVRIGRSPGYGPQGAQVTEEVWRRDLDGPDKGWRPEMGNPGAGLDAEAMTALLTTLRSVRPLEWEHYHAEDAERMGFRVDGGAAATAWFEIAFRADGLPDVILLVGSKLPDRDAYHARVKGQAFAFLLDADTVSRLTAPLTK